MTLYIEAAQQFLSTSFGQSTTVIPSKMFDDRWSPKRNIVRYRVDSSAPDPPETIILPQKRDPIEFDRSDIRSWGLTYQVFDYWTEVSFLTE